MYRFLKAKKIHNANKNDFGQTVMKLEDIPVAEVCFTWQSD